MGTARAGGSIGQRTIAATEYVAKKPLLTEIFLFKCALRPSVGGAKAKASYATHDIEPFSVLQLKKENH